VLSELPPGRGVNFSGATAAALALAIWRLNFPGEELPVEILQGEIESKEVFSEHFRFVARLAMVFEQRAHHRLSGYGPLVSLIPSRGELVTYCPWLHKHAIPGSTVDLEAKRIQKVALRRWSHVSSGSTGGPLGQLVLMVVDTGEPKNTKEAQLAAAKRETSTYEFVEPLVQRATTVFGGNEVKAPWAQELARKTHVTGLAIASLATAHSLAEMEAVHSEPDSFLRVIQTIDSLHRRLGLHWDQYSRAKEKLEQKLLKRLGPSGWATKLSGGGQGGSFVLFLRRESDGKTADLAQAAVEAAECAVVFRSDKDGLDQDGPQVEQRRTPESGPPPAPAYEARILVGKATRWERLDAAAMPTLGLDVRELAAERGVAALFHCTLPAPLAACERDHRKLRGVTFLAAKRQGSAGRSEWQVVDPFLDGTQRSNEACAALLLLFALDGRTRVSLSPGQGTGLREYVAMQTTVRPDHYADEHAPDKPPLARTVQCPLNAAFEQLSGEEGPFLRRKKVPKPEQSEWWWNLSLPQNLAVALFAPLAQSGSDDGRPEPQASGEE
jgi:hypothetical protein